MQCGSLDAVSVTGWNQINGQRQWPVVQFRRADGSVVETVVTPEVIESRTQEGQLLGRRCQLPIIPAVCITVHKSQGLTLDGVVVDMAEFWEHGQGHTAFSRIGKLEGLYLLGGVDPSKIICDHKVTDFLASRDWVVVMTAERRL